MGAGTLRYTPSVLPLSGLDREAIKLAALVSGFPTVQGACWAAQRNGWTWITAVQSNGRITAAWRVRSGFARPVDFSQPIEGYRQMSLGL